MNRPPLGLSEREWEIVRLGADGMTDKEIARRLGLSVTTITTHWVRMREKLKAFNRGQVIAKAMTVVFRESQEELARANALYRSLVDTLEDFAVFMLDEERQILTWNPGVERIFGYSESEWVGMNADEIFGPEDRARDIPQKEQEQAKREGRADDNRWHVKKGGARFWASGVFVALRDESGEIVCYFKVLQDLTRLKRMEEQVRVLGGKPT